MTIYLTKRSIQNIEYPYLGNEDVLSLIEGSFKILDLGCGDGSFGQAIKTEYGSIVHGVTNSKAELAAAGEKLDRVFDLNLDAFDPSMVEERYDCILMSHVLEHLVWPADLVSTVSALLVDEGRIIIALPNLMHFSSRMKLIFGHFEYAENGVFDLTHLRFFTYDNFEKCLVPESGYSAEKWAVGHFPMPFIRRIIPKSLCSKIDSLSVRIVPGLFSSQFGLILRKI